MTLDLEQKAVEIEINGIKKKVVQLYSSVKSVLGVNKPIRMNLTPEQMLANPPTFYQKTLTIGLDEKLKEQGIGLLKFRGQSPVKTADHIRAGVILDGDLETFGVGKALYIQIYDNGIPLRLDFRDGYDPTYSEAEKLGLT